MTNHRMGSYKMNMVGQWRDLDVIIILNIILEKKLVDTVPQHQINIQINAEMVNIVWGEPMYISSITLLGSHPSKLWLICGDM